MIPIRKLSRTKIERVVLGSTNPNKLIAVQRTFSLYPFLAQAEIIPVAVDSRVPPQPLSLDEIITGATHRAVSAFTHQPSQLSIGIEAGLMPIPLLSSGYVNISACVMFDGDTTYHGLSPAFELPARVIELITQTGVDLDEAAFQAGISTISNIGRNIGIIGILTKRRIDRVLMDQYAIMMTLIHLENDMS